MVSSPARREAAIPGCEFCPMLRVMPFWSSNRNAPLNPVVLGGCGAGGDQPSTGRVGHYPTTTANEWVAVESRGDTARIRTRLVWCRGTLHYGRRDSELKPGFGRITGYLESEAKNLPNSA